MVVSWPARIEKDVIPRTSFLHLVDVVPTILEATGVPMPDSVNGVDQKPLEGESFLASFNDPDYKGRTEQYFEVFSNRSMYANGWKANAQHTFPWRQDFAPGNWDKDTWELYNLDTDFSEANDLADEHPEKLEELKAMLAESFEKYGVLPLDDRGAGRLTVEKPPVPGTSLDAKIYTYFAGAYRIPETAGPPMKNRSWALTAKIETDGEDTNGVIMASGGMAAGVVLYLDRGVPVFDYNHFEEHTVLRGIEPLPSGASEISLNFNYLGAEGEFGEGAEIILTVDGVEVARGEMEATVAGRFGVDPFDIGRDSAQPVAPSAYSPPFAFTGEIKTVVIELL